MTLYNVTLEQVEQKVREIAKRNPKKVYAPAGTERACRYHLTRNNSAHRKDRCIFGQAFSELGVSEEDLVNIRSYSASAAIRELFDIDNDDPDRYNRLLALRSVQVAQDRGESWGEAIKRLDR